MNRRKEKMGKENTRRHCEIYTQTNIAHKYVFPKYIIKINNIRSYLHSIIVLLQQKCFKFCILFIFFFCSHHLPSTYENVCMCVCAARRQRVAGQHF